VKIYLVGGAIRDDLLGIAVTERDWVVVGATPQQLLGQGYQAVGKDFPVFLHPDSHEEYALARTERKVSRGYRGFEFYADPDVTLEQDLQRRDLTVNAIAQDEHGKLIDPYHGQQDCEAKILRHVSEAFAEDPVRVLRVARFASKLPGFTVATETNHLMQTMVDNGEVDALVAERVCKELLRALMYDNPGRFFEVLDACGAGEKLWPDLSHRNKGVQILQRCAQDQMAIELRFSCLCHDLNLATIKQLCQRYKLPNNLADAAITLQQHATTFSDLNPVEPASLLHFLLKLDAIRRPQRLALFLQASHYCGISSPLPTATLIALAEQLRSLDTMDLQNQGLSGPEFGKALEQKRLQCIARLLKQ
jgi:tRNA nucleotidyltransferase (CCA-adding enzyme)